MTHELPEFYEVAVEGHGCFRPVGSWTLADIVEAVDRAILCSRDRGIRCLIADVSAATGFVSPTLSERFHFISKWAATADGTVTLCVVARDEMILEDKFGTVFAANRGLSSNVFSTPDEALRWLTSNCPTSTPIR